MKKALINSAFSEWFSVKVKRIQKNTQMLSISHEKEYNEREDIHSLGYLGAYCPAYHFISHRNEGNVTFSFFG